MVLLGCSWLLVVFEVLDGYSWFLVVQPVRWFMVVLACYRCFSVVLMVIDGFWWF